MSGRKTNILQKYKNKKFVSSGPSLNEIEKEMLQTEEK